jgi:hypothetical protein
MTINKQPETSPRITYFHEHMRALANRYTSMEYKFNRVGIPFDLGVADRYEIARVRFNYLNEQLINYGVKECYLKIYGDTCSNTNDFLCIHCQEKKGIKNDFKLPY